ncbi:MAG: sigma-70 family RNA polymerase sigma factor [Deltaproteobacteria bacterium]|nr:MAG: sigma-70 family RNA polymerase sigma factor [Deltaproteobacteria bacterium]
MMRVTRIAAGTTLRVEGRLTHQTVEELRMACETVITEEGALRLDVSGLQFVDPTGVALLRGLTRRGTRLGGCSGFLTELLREQDQRPAGPPPTSRSDGDDALVDRLRRGDPEAFESLVRQYGGRMLATARRLVGTEDEARDVVQEAFLAAFRAIDSFAGAARLSTWLHRIVVNGALMKLRSRRRRREESIEGLLPRFDDDGHWAEPSPQWDNASDALCERQETREMVRNAIGRLPASSIQRPSRAVGLSRSSPTPCAPARPCRRSFSSTAWCWRAGSRTSRRSRPPTGCPTGSSASCCSPWPSGRCSRSR